jgi:hypothetical protein
MRGTRVSDSAHLRVLRGELCGLSTLAVAGIALAQEIPTFDVPGAGYYRLSVLGQCHGFLRDPSGTMTTIDVPDAPGTSTFPRSINTAGLVTGGYSDGAVTQKGLIRHNRGRLTTFNVPGASSTFPQSINPSGTVAGYFVVNAGYPRTHALLRTADGAITTFDRPRSSESQAALRTTAWSVKAAGEVAASFWDPSFGDVGFVRAADGTFTTFHFGPPYTEVAAIYPAGTVTGSASLSRWASAIVRTADGSVTEFNVRSNGRDMATIPSAINPAGTVTGRYLDDAPPYQWHGFVRTAH